MMRRTETAPAGASWRTPVGEVRFAERRGGGWMFYLMVGTPLAAWVHVSWDALFVDASEGRWAVALGIATALSAFIALLFCGPIGTSFKHLRVDDAGLWVRSRLLPADRLGGVEVLSPKEVARSHATSRFRGRSVLRAVSAYSFLTSSSPTVMVEERLGEVVRRPWLVMTDDPDGLVTALAAVGAQVQDGPDEVQDQQAEDDDPSAVRQQGRGHVRLLGDDDEGTPHG